MLGIHERILAHVMLLQSAPLLSNFTQQAKENLQLSGVVCITLDLTNAFCATNSIVSQFIPT